MTPTEPQLTPFERWIPNLPGVAVKFLAFLGLAQLPPSVRMEPWEVNALQYYLDGPLAFLKGIKSAEYASLGAAATGELLGALMSLALSIAQPSEEVSRCDAAIPAAAEFRKNSGEALDGLAGHVVKLAGEYAAGLSGLPPLKTQREFAAGYLKGLNAVFEDDGETMKKESAKMFLCILFLGYADELRPAAGMTLTQVHAWVTDMTLQPISLENVRKVAGEIGLKLADPGHPSG